MSVITMNNPSSLRVKLDAGLNDSTGNTIVKSKTYSNLKYNANNQDVYDVAQALMGLQDYCVEKSSQKRISYQKPVKADEKYNKNITRHSFNAGRYCNSRFIPFSTVCQISPLTGTDPAPPPRSSGASPAAHGAAARGT